MAKADTHLLYTASISASIRLSAVDRTCSSLSSRDLWAALLSFSLVFSRLTSLATSFPTAALVSLASRASRACTCLRRPAASRTSTTVLLASISLSTRRSRATEFLSTPRTTAVSLETRELDSSEIRADSFVSMATTLSLRVPSAFTRAAVSAAKESWIPLFSFANLCCTRSSAAIRVLASLSSPAVRACCSDFTDSSTFSMRLFTAPSSFASSFCLVLVWSSTPAVLVASILSACLVRVIVIFSLSSAFEASP
mmetsp:Transcript_22564/g.51452  ORF Transcript_22564/g.51452 Transcript_22564/m.51452 type:complete len:254 (+) Transcript_22564:686-1447(+)